MKTFLAGLALALSVHAAEREARMERRPLLDGRVEKVWSTAESRASVETNRVPAGARALRWQITVDHFGGEPKYPIGWPRLWRAFQGGERDWSAYDFLEFRVRADTTREILPATPVTLLLRGNSAEGNWSRPLTELKKGEWITYAIPIANLLKPEEVSQIMFSISDENYRHKDEVDFTIADLALTRFAAPTLLDFAPEQAILFSDARGLPVRFRVSGVKAGERGEIVCELKREGKTVSRLAATTGRGSQRMVLPLRDALFPPGAYELVGKITGGPPQTSVVRLVESPWTQERDRP